jgi:cytochrome c oxidase subunit I+III
MPPQTWGVRSIPEIDSRYPLWDQPNFLRDVDEGRFYLPDSEEEHRETLVTSVIDAKPIQCLRVFGASFIPLVAAVFTGGIFIFPTFKLWWPAAASAVLAVATIIFWLWTGSAAIPSTKLKDAGVGITLPRYLSGSASVGWWAMFITMLGDMTAFVSVVFGYFFYWTRHTDFPPKDSPDLGSFWLVAAAGFLIAAWGLTVLSRIWNRRDRPLAFYVALATAVILAVAGIFALIAGPWLARLDPARNVYPAIVWLLVIWTALHVAVGVVMQLYCVARRLAGRMTAEYDIDIGNVALYWHFAVVTVMITVGVIAGFPQLA